MPHLLCFIYPSFTHHRMSFFLFLSSFYFQYLLFLFIFSFWCNILTLLEKVCHLIPMTRKNYRYVWELIFIYCGLLSSSLVDFFFCVCVVFLLSLRFGQISPLAFFRWFTATSDRNDESCNRIQVPGEHCQKIAV